MLSNAYFLAKFRFETAENEPAKNLQNFAKFANFADPNALTRAYQALRPASPEFEPRGPGRLQPPAAAHPRRARARARSPGASARWKLKIKN